MISRGRAKKVYYSIRNRFTSGALILMYHRVADLSADPFHLAVSPDYFAQHLEYIQQTCRPMRLLELVEAVSQGSIPKRAVVITFDDGYIDNLEQAQPLLKAAGLPWTLFVTSGGIDNPRNLWWDELSQLLSSKQLPPQLQICIEGQPYTWPLTTEAERQQACAELHRCLLPLPSADRDRYLAELISWAGAEHARHPENRLMTTDELRRLGQSENVDIGAHTITHPFLPALAPDDQQAEIVGSRHKLETIFDRPVSTFSYPYGRVAPETAEIVERTGFGAAVTAVPGRVEAGDNPFLLGRSEVKNWDLESFKQRLEAFFATRRQPK